MCACVCQCVGLWIHTCDNIKINTLENRKRNDQNMKVLIIIILIVGNGSLTLLHVFLCYSEMPMGSGIRTRLVVTMPTMMNVQCLRRTTQEGRSSRALPSMSTNLKWVRKDNLDNFPSFSSWLKFIEFHQIMRK